MNSLLEWRPPVPPDEFDPVESGFAGLPTRCGPPAAHSILIEEQLTDDAYRVHAELPGLDPEKDIRVNVAQGVLTLRAERSQQAQHRSHGEFRYGSFFRAVRLPAGAREDGTRATYKDGILTVTVPVTSAGKEKKEGIIPVYRVVTT
ncbi:molecular chaperone Hsp20 [Streptomyces rimosus subsp. pseudoverticillatus]|uniref:Hsp20/alpha crystallin family protein n=1 Tax=Streptomyces rimosus TaxID=1927 RepID=UPI0006B2974D|nr:Hsp20/alpha crystallin family protein [Streptomyces rimosus]KOT90117.1 molecular chaperone Hsp20 [Streptomyces rimosus subsp. pseudoverticillatus]